MSPDDQAAKVRADLIRLYDRMKVIGWLKGYELKGNAAVLDFTPNGHGANVMLNRLFFDGDPARALAMEDLDGFIAYLETIVRHSEDPARYLSRTGDSN